MWSLCGWPPGLAFDQQTRPCCSFDDADSLGSNVCRDLAGSCYFKPSKAAASDIGVAVPLEH